MTAYAASRHKPPLTPVSHLQLQHLQIAASEVAGEPVPFTAALLL